MKHLISTLMVLVLCTTGFAQQTINGSIVHDDLTRTYIIYVPDSYTGNTEVPLILNFHGYTSNATEQMWYGDFRSIADTAGFLVVHPQGTLFNGTPHWNVGGWTVGSMTDDVGFTSALIDSLASQYAIDLNRVYSTGMSNGGYMSFLLACQLSNKIAAIASVTGSMTPETYVDCDPQHPTPVMQIHGTVDGVVPYNGAGWTKSITEVLQYWQSYNNCFATPNSASVPNTNTADGSFVEHIVYEQGDNMVTTEHFKITGGGHTWAGTFINSPGTNYDIDASEEIWKFFSRFDINGLISTTSIDPLAENKQFSLYPNPTTDHIWIQGPDHRWVDYEVLNLNGQRLLSGQVRPGGDGIELGELPVGLYILQVDAEQHKVLKIE